MNKFYKLFLLVIVFIFITTYNSKELSIASKENNSLFKLKFIEIQNNSLVSKIQINKILDHLYEKNIFSINSEDIEKPLEKIDFLEKIEVKKKYPNTILIKVFETKPLAVLFKNQEKYLIDNASNLILIKSDFNIENLPSVYGENSQDKFVYFLKKLKKNEFPYKKIKNFYYYKIGRWDLQFFNDKIIKFPHNNINEAINKSIELLDREDFSNYKIIDLRVDGKIIVE